VLKGGRARLSALETIDLSICPGAIGARPRNQISYQYQISYQLTGAAGSVHFVTLGIPPSQSAGGKAICVSTIFFKLRVSKMQRNVCLFVCLFV